MRLHIHRFLLLLLIVLFGFSLSAKDFPARSKTAVADYIGLLNASKRHALEQKLKVFNDTSSSAIVIVIDDSTDGEDLFGYSHRLAEKWGIGSKGKENGVLMYIAFNDRKIRIQVGSGLEGVVTDAVSKRIIESIIGPAFRAKKYYNGLNEATDILISLSSGEFTADEYSQDYSDNSGVYILLAIFLLIFLISIISVYRCRKRGDCNDGGGYYDGGRYNSGGGWIIGGGSGFGGSSGGGFGGGGFGGFGGGGFSGGGAGGGW